MKRWLVIVLALPGLSAYLHYWLFTPNPIPVFVMDVERGRVEETVTNWRAGTIIASQRAKLSPEIVGRVAAIPHRKGAHVRAGDVLLRLHDESQ